VKIAISINGDNPNPLFDPRFGRAQAFCIFDTDTAAYQIYDNSAVTAAGGAGVMAAQSVVEHGVEAVISGSFGPNAYEALAAANIKMLVLPDGVGLTVQDVIEKFGAGELTETQAPSHKGHHGRASGAGRGRGAR
jgi:predicted Fe-Mo cluster-binding NifX family protein